jgi:hypothetical protein
VAYIHLNPLRAGMVKELDELRWYRWYGHSVVIGQRESDFLAKFVARQTQMDYHDLGPFG